MNKYEQALDIIKRDYACENVSKKEFPTGEEVENAIEELEELVDKETPMKVEEELELFRCPNCNEKLLIYKMSINYCYECGQKLDWSEE